MRFDVEIRRFKPQHTPSLARGNPIQRSGGRAGNEARHNEGVYLTLCLRRVEILASFSGKSSLELSNGRCPGCDYTPIWFSVSHHCILWNAMHCCIDTPYGLDFHIGVGSDVVCSTGLGNARASIRGTDNW